MMKNMDKKEKDQQKRDAVNVRVKDAEVKSVNPSAFAATGADKVLAVDRFVKRYGLQGILLVVQKDLVVTLGQFTGPASPPQGGGENLHLP